MSAILYVLCGSAVLWMVHKQVQPLSRWAAVVLLLLPLCFTGRALFTGAVYGPIDLAYQSEPLASLARQYGVDRIHNPALSDVQLLMIPWRAAVREALRRGEWPLWNPYIFSGDILAANMEPAPYHPTNLLSLLLPLPQGITFAAAMTFFLAGMAMFFYLRDIGCSEAPSIFGAVGWMFSSFLVFFIEYPMGNAALLLPLVFLGVRRMIRGSSLLLTAGLVLLVLTGHPETMLHVVALGIAYSFFEMWSAAGSAAGPRAARPLLRIFARGISCGVLALLLTAFFLLPFVDALLQSQDYRDRTSRFVRQSRTVSWNEAGDRLRLNVLPFLYGDPTVELASVPRSYVTPHSGYAGSILFPFAILAVWRARWPGRWFMLVLIIVGWLAGVAAPGLTDVLSRLPLFSIALNERLVFGAVAGLVVLAALGLESVIVKSATQNLALLSLIVLALLSAAIAMQWRGMMQSGLSSSFVHAGVIRSLVPLVILVAATALAAHKSSASIVPVAVALLLVQRVVEAGTTYPTLPARAFYPPVRAFEALDQKQSRIVGVGYTLIPNTGIHYRLSDVRGFHGMTFSRLFDTFVLWSIHQPVWFNRVENPDRPFLSFLNVRYAIADQNTSPPASWKRIASTGGVQVFENPSLMPRAFIPHRVRLNVSAEAIIGEMGQNRDFGKLAWINTGDKSRGETSNGVGTVTLRRLGSGYELQTEMQKPGWIVISETAWKGWKASLRGAKLPIAFANHAFIAVGAPPGRHRIVLRYWPDSFTWGLISSGLSAVALIAYWLFRRRARSEERGARGAGSLFALRSSLLCLIALMVGPEAMAAHPGTDLFLPVAGKATGAGGLHFATALWITNVSTETARIRLEFLRGGEPNPSPTPLADEFQLAAGETRFLDNVTESVLLAKGLGGLRIRSNVEVMATARLYSRREDQTSAATQGLSYSAIPAHFAIGNGESAILQGVSQGGDFRYNASFVETTGQSAGIWLELRDHRGAVMGRRNYILQGYEQRTISTTTLFPEAVTDNAVLFIKVITGTGKVIAVGSQVAAQSNDGSVFEMQLPRERASRLARTEVAVYVLASLALLGAAAVQLIRARKPPHP